MFKCCKCPLEFQLSELRRHISINHAFEKEEFSCMIDGCERLYDNINSYFRHLKSHSLDEEPLVQPSVVQSSVEEPLVQHSDAEIFVDFSAKSHHQQNLAVKPIYVVKLEEMKLKFLKIIVKYLSDASLSRSKVFEIISDCCSFYASIISEIENTTKKQLEFYSIEDIIYLDEIFHFTIYAKVPSEHIVFRDLRDLGYIVSIDTKLLSTEGTIFYTNAMPVVKEIKYEYKLVSLRSLFQHVFKLPNYLDSIHDFMSCLKLDESTSISNILQSSLWKSKVNSYNEPETLFLPLLLYFDDFEPFNALGSKSGAYKIGAVYTKIMCLPPELDSKLINIYPCMLFFADDRKTFSDKVLFRPLIDELNYLHTTGIEINFRTFKRIKLIVTLICGDNLGLNGILGFTESFRCHHFCRLCRVEKKFTDFQFSEDLSKWRTKENYIEDVLLNNISLTGVCKDCPWNILLKFHVVENFSVDIMHDLLEGVCHYDMAHIISKLIKCNWFTLDILNERIKMFNDNSKNKNKIGFVTQTMLDNKSLKSSAAEMLYFMNNFPFILDGLIDDECNPV